MRVSWEGMPHLRSAAKFLTSKVEIEADQGFLKMYNPCGPANLLCKTYEHILNANVFRFPTLTALITLQLCIYIIALCFVKGYQHFEIILGPFKISPFSYCFLMLVCLFLYRTVSLPWCQGLHTVLFKVG